MFSLSHLPNQQQNEKVIILIRRHWFILFRFIFLFLFLSFLPLLFYLFFVFTWPGVFAEIFFYAIMVIFFSLYYLCIWLLFFYSFLDYYLDIWIVTNYRIINIEQIGLFNRVISEQKLYRVQDVTSEVKGIAPTFFDYGYVYIQTAGERARFVFEQIPHPSDIRKKILALAEQNKHFQKVISQDD